MRVTFTLLAVLIMLDYLFFTSIHASGDDNDNNTNKAYAKSYSNSEGGDASAVSEGSTISVDGSSGEDNFFSFATTFPQSSGCFGGVQGGASASSGGGGFFGLHFINHNCWTSALAEAEANVDVRSRLKCAGKHFRNAIAFDHKGTSLKKQVFCVTYMNTKYVAEIEHLKTQVESAMELGELTPATEGMVMAANVTQEEFEEQAQMVEDKNAQQQNQIEALEQRTRKAEARAAQAETQLKKIQQQQTSKKQALQQLQQQVQQDYVIEE